VASKRERVERWIARSVDGNGWLAQARGVEVSVHAPVTVAGGMWTGVAAVAVAVMQLKSVGQVRRGGEQMLSAVQIER